MGSLYQVPFAPVFSISKDPQKRGQPPVGFYATNSLIQIAIFGHFWVNFGSILDANFDLFSQIANKSYVAQKIHFFDTNFHCFFH